MSDILLAEKTKIEAKNPIQIIVRNPIWSYISCPAAVKNDLSYTDYYWKRTYEGMRRIEYTASMINAQGYFLTGLIDRVKDSLNRQKIPFHLITSDKMQKIDNEVLPSNGSLPNIALRDDQKRLVKSALEKRRGLLVAMPGMGKTIIALSIIKAFDGKTILFLVPTLTLLRQTVDELKKFGFDSICTLGEGQKEIKGKIIVSTVQTCRTLNLKASGYLFDVVIVDEVHNFITNTTLKTILMQILAPVRIGLTATPPTDKHKTLLCEGLLGPIIDMVTIEEGKMIDVLANPKLRLVTVPYKHIESKVYNEVYDEAIVYNDARNEIIVSEICNLAKQNKSSIVFVGKLEHGKILYDMLKEKNVKVEYVRGSVISTERNETKYKLENKEILVAIASKVWREGLNIRSLDAVILAHGGKSEIAVMQSIGRALRKTNEKNDAIIIDFLDRCRYLSEHCVERLGLYVDMGWI